MPEGSSITAFLGPTNTGKTHRAVERMLAYDSGIIGLPLRLLAREVYDRITTRIGEARVALVTGEERRVPRRPDYWVCTVEAMPMDIEVDFLAVDEIQLAAHDQRGHVFTDRLLAARGVRETWFMGAATMQPILGELCPTAKILSHPRLSRLSSAGALKLSQTPPKSAVVAFGAAQVYAIAERLRALRGGAAVVLGALSPRTRNAQVALFEAGEVDYLVATDAIGMGLNLSVNHVAFAALRKFDGRKERDLEPAEIAQIAGRAGRYMNDGTFGTVMPLALPDGVVRALEAHRFPPVQRLLYRNHDLDRSSIDALLASLRQRPRTRSLRLVEDAEDMAALTRLVQDPSVRARAQGEEAVSLLWDVCRIPDFRKLLIEPHVALLAEIFAQLSGPAAVLDEDWMTEIVGGIDDPAGDIDTLLARIAAIRTWTYISQKTRWVRGADEWQERTRAIEDRLSDALHAQLVQRFVERSAGKRATASRPRARGIEPQPAPSEIRPGHPFAQLSALRLSLATPRAAPTSGASPWVEDVIAAPHERFSVDVSGRIRDGERELAQLTRGTSLLLPEVRLLDHDELGAGARSRVLRRLVAFARDLIGELLAPLRAADPRSLAAAVRGVVYQLEQGLGTAVTRAALPQIEGLVPEDRAALVALGVSVGERVLYVPSLLKRPALERRLALAAAYFEPSARPACPPPGAVSFAPARGTDPRACTAIGYPVFGPRAVRADIAERVYQVIVTEGLSEAKGASLLGCSPREALRVCEAIEISSAH